MRMTLNNKSYDCVHCWEKLKTGQFQRIYREWDMDKDILDRDFFKLFSILSNSKFASVEATPENEVTIWNAIKWVIETPMNFRTDLPKVLSIPSGLLPNKVVMVPEEIGELSIGQNIHLKNELQGAKFREEKLAIATAIFLQPLVDGKPFDMKMAKKLAERLEEMPVYLIYPIGFFLLNRALKTGSHSPNLWSRIKTSLSSMLKRMWRH